MNAAELLALGKHIEWYSGQIWSPDDSKKLAAAAEILELLAWAEESEVHVERYGGMWFVYLDGVEYVGDTLLGTLRRAREAAK